MSFGQSIDEVSVCAPIHVMLKIKLEFHMDSPQVPTTRYIPLLNRAMTCGDGSGNVFQIISFAVQLNSLLTLNFNILINIHVI